MPDQSPWNDTPPGQEPLKPGRFRALVTQGQPRLGTFQYNRRLEEKLCNSGNPLDYKCGLLCALTRWIWGPEEGPFAISHLLKLACSLSPLHSWKGVGIGGQPMHTHPLLCRSFKALHGQNLSHVCRSVSHPVVCSYRYTRLVNGDDIVCRVPPLQVHCPSHCHTLAGNSSLLGSLHSFFSYSPTRCVSCL